MVKDGGLEVYGSKGAGGDSRGQLDLAYAVPGLTCPQREIYGTQNATPGLDDVWELQLSATCVCSMGCEGSVGGVWHTRVSPDQRKRTVFFCPGHKLG